MAKISKEDALIYHESGRPGKIEVKPTKAYRTQTDLSLAYSPGVAYPCLEIQENPDDAYRYTMFLNMYEERISRLREPVWLEPGPIEDIYRRRR